MTTNFRINGTDFDDVFVRKDLFSEGGLWSWSYSAGDGTGITRSSPVQTIATGTNWKQINGSSEHKAAIKTDGTLWIWGSNSEGQLGDNTITTRSSPVQTISAGTNWKQVSVGRYHTAAIKTDGSLWLWGNNFRGQLGDNTTTRKSSPVLTVSGGFNWKQVNANGEDNTCAIKTDGTLWTWGRNDYGELGTNDRTARSSPVQTVAGGTNWKQVAQGTGHTVAIKTDGTLWTWGRNNYGQLGDNTRTNRSSPVQTISGGTDWKQVACGRLHTAAIKTDGTLWLWGVNFQGHLGDNTTTDKSSPVQTVSGGTNWKQVSSGYDHTAAIKSDGTLWLWGRNNGGELGDNTVVDKSSPVQTVAGGTYWKMVAAGRTSCAISEDYWA